MNDDKLLNDPTNRVVSVFEDKNQATAAREDLIATGLDDDNVRLFHGEKPAEQADTSAKWFADTHIDIKRFVRQLDEGNTVVSAELTDRDQLEEIQDIFKRHGGQMTTHFGDWVTEVLE